MEGRNSAAYEHIAISTLIRFSYLMCFGGSQFYAAYEHITISNIPTVDYNVSSLAANLVANLSSFAEADLEVRIKALNGALFLWSGQGFRLRR